MKIRTDFAALAAALLLVGLAPVQFASAQAPKGAVDGLVGTWNGPISAGGGTVTFVVKLQVDDMGKLQGSLAVPEQGGVALPMSEVQLAGDKFSFKIPAVMGEFTSTYASGVLNGRWRQGDPSIQPDGYAVILKKGEYVAPVHVLNLDAQSFGTLAGTWQGDMQVPAPQGEVTLAVVLRFEKNPHGDVVAFMDIPNQKMTGIAVSEVTLAAGKLVVKIPGLSGEYDANLSGTSMAGQLSMGQGSVPLTLTKK